MEGKKTYRINYEKAIEALVWLADKKPKIDIYHIAKVLYYAEKTHLNKYANPIIGDTYIRMDYGQVPSGVRDLITKNSWLEPNYLDAFSNSLVVNKDPYDNLIALRKPNLEYFSDTDIECLEQAFMECVNLTFEELKKKSHDEKTWLETEPNGDIDYLLMIDEQNPYREEITEEINQTSQYARL